MSDIPVITHIDLPLSDRCNLRCSFCYTHGGHGNSYSQEHIDKTFNWFLSQFNTGATEKQREYGLRVSIYGGEPLYEWENLKRVVVDKGKEAQALGIRLRFSIITNMTLLDEEKLDWLMAHRVGIHPSIDGCAEAQDAERVFRDGTGSSEIVYENAKRLLSRMGNRSCRMTVAPSTVGLVYKSITFLTKDIGFNTVNAILAGGVDWSEEDLDTYKLEIEKVTDWWIDEMRAGRHYSLYHLRNMFSGIWSGRRIRTLCGAGRGQVGIDTKGNFYPCHRYCNFQSKPEYLMGNLDDGFTNTKLRDTFQNFDLTQYHKERCKDCPAVLGCHALCTHEMMLADKGMFEPLPHYCNVWPFYWKMAMRAHSVLMAENNQLYIRTYDPRVQQRNRQMEQQRRQQIAQRKQQQRNQQRFQVKPE